MADQSTNLPWAKGMNYGMGVNLLNGDIAGKAVDPGTITEPTQAGGQTTRYNLTLINSFEELYSSIGISVEASGQYGLFSAAGKFNYAKESKFNSQATFLLARCVVENAFTQVEDAQIKAEASELLKQGKVNLFQQRYGDGFVRGMQAGGEFFAVISIFSSSREAQEALAASLRAKYGGLFASAEFNVKLDNETKSNVSRNELLISTYQRGGVGDDQSLTDDIETVMARLKDFPKQVQNKPVPYDVQVASYNTLALPQGPNPIDIQAQNDALADYARIQLKLLALRNDIEFLQLHPDFFVNPPKAVTLTQWQEFVTDQLNQLTRQASKCLNNPVGGCDLFTLKLPEDFLMPERTGVIAGVWKHITERLAYGPQQLLSDTPDNVGVATWEFSPLGKNRYQAQETGLGNAKGLATLNGRRLELNVEGAGEAVARYVWELNSDFTSGEGTLVFLKGWKDPWTNKDNEVRKSQLIRLSDSE